MVKKVTVVGSGSAGATAAQRLAEKELREVVLVDIVTGISQGKALDLTAVAPIEKHDAHLTGTNGYAESADSGTLIITADIPITERILIDRNTAPFDRKAYNDAEIASLLKTGRAYYTPASAAVEQAEDILVDINKVLPCLAMLTGEYEFNDLFSGFG